MQIGRISIPDVSFPTEMREELSAYIAQTGDSCGYISEVGVDHPEMLKLDPGLFRLFAALKYLEENPENGLAVINVGLAFDELGQIDHAVEVLGSLEGAGCPGLYGDVWYEDPGFLAGWWLADVDRFEDALQHYQRAVAREQIREKGPIWVHMGTVFHSLSSFDKAMECYRKAIAAFQEELVNPASRIRNPHFTQEDIARSVSLTERHCQEQIAIIVRLKEDASNHLPCRGVRYEGGVGLPE